MATQIDQAKKAKVTDIATALKKEAATNPAFRDVAHLFATRERTRHQVTLHTLSANMMKAGFDYPRSRYIRVLEFLASLGLGRPLHNSKGKIKALVDIKHTLQSIGLAAVGDNLRLDAAKNRNQYKDLPGAKPAHPAPLKDEKEALVRVSLNIGGVEVPIESSLSPTALGSLLLQLVSKEHA